MSEQATVKSDGVQNLIQRIRDEGVQAARLEADNILREARQQAAQILSTAQADANACQAKAQADIDAYQTAAQEALRLSARDTVLNLKSQIGAQFETFVKRLVTDAMHDKELIRALVLVLAGQSVHEFIANKDIEIMVSKSIFSGQPNPEMRERTKQSILSLSSDMLREGVTLLPDKSLEGGARVRLVDEKLEIDLSDRTVARMIYERILPRFRSIVEGVE